MDTRVPRTDLVQRACIFAGEFATRYAVLRATNSPVAKEVIERLLRFPAPGRDALLDRRLQH